MARTAPAPRPRRPKSVRCPSESGGAKRAEVPWWSFLRSPSGFSADGGPEVGLLDRILFFKAAIVNRGRGEAPAFNKSTVLTYLQPHFLWSKRRPGRSFERPAGGPAYTISPTIIGC